MPPRPELFVEQNLVDEELGQRLGRFFVALNAEDVRIVLCSGYVDEQPGLRFGGHSADAPCDAGTEWSTLC